MVDSITFGTGFSSNNKGYLIKGVYYTDFKMLKVDYPFLDKQKFDYCIKNGFTAEQVINVLERFNEYPTKRSVIVYNEFYRTAKDFFDTYTEVSPTAFKKAVKDTGNSYEEVLETFRKEGKYYTDAYLIEDARKKGKEYGVTILGKFYPKLKDFFEENPQLSESSARSKASLSGITVVQAIENKLTIGTYEGRDNSVTIRGVKYPSATAFFREQDKYSLSCCKNVMYTEGLTFDEALDNYDKYGSYKGLRDNRTTAVVIRGKSYVSIQDFFDKHPQYKRSSCIPVASKFNISIEEALDNFDATGTYLPESRKVAVLN